MLQTFSSWIPGSSRKCHTVHLPRAESRHCSQQFPHRFYLCKARHRQVSVLFLFMLSLHDTTCSSIHLPPHSLHYVCTVSAALCCRQGGNPVASAGPQQDSQSERTLALPDFFVCSDYFAQAWSVLSWDCITIGMPGNGYETSHCRGAPHHPDMKFCKLISVFRIAAVALWSLRILKAWAAANRCGMVKSTTGRVQWSSPRPCSTPASYI